ncbi:hypothetical protein BGX24_006995 [Mortierella sp. AD032]|nr:hypothetical protein BGX24_006995 [Mortierella sp. AD032]
MGRNVLMTNESYYILLNKFLRSNICSSTLRTLHIYRVAHNPIRLLESIVLHLTGLRELHLFGGGGIVPYRRMPCLGPKAARMFLENCPTGLEELVFGVKVKGDQPPELCSIHIPSEEEKSRSTRTHPHLRILSLPGSMNGFEEQVLAAGENGFLQGCTGLEVIESPNDAYLRNYWITDNVVIRNVLSEREARPVAARGKVLRRFCASVEDTGLPPDPVQQQLQQQSAVVYQLQQQELEVQEIDPSMRDELLSESILAIQATNQIAGTGKEAWHTIVVHNAGPLVAQAIALTSFEQQDALVALDLIDSYGVTSNHIQEILAHSKLAGSHEPQPATKTKARRGVALIKQRAIGSNAKCIDNSPHSQDYKNSDSVKHASDKMSNSMKPSTNTNNPKTPPPPSTMQQEESQDFKKTA